MRYSRPTPPRGPSHTHPYQPYATRGANVCGAWLDGKRDTVDGRIDGRYLRKVGGQLCPASALFLCDPFPFFFLHSQLVHGPVPVPLPVPVSDLQPTGLR